MFYLNYFNIFTIVSTLNGLYGAFIINNNSDDLENNDIPVDLSANDVYQLINKDNFDNGDKVEVRLYYETLCPDCIKFDKEQFGPAVEKLGPYVNFRTYPYGNAETIRQKGVIQIKCQHGERECYGNKLHACAIDNLNNITQALLFNACMMGGKDRGSNDAAADRCAKGFGVDPSPIKACAKGNRGTTLLEQYGEESKEANFNYVPYILLNGKENDGDSFLKDVCAAFAVTPPPCVEFYQD